MRRLALGAVVALCVACGLAACSTPELASVGASSRAVAASEIFAQGPRTQLMREPGGSLTQRREVHAPDARGVWELVLFRPVASGNAAAEPLRTLRLECEPQGGVLLRELEDHEKGTVSLFTPPLRLMPASVDAGAVQTSEASLRVVDAATRSRGMDQGGATAACRLVEAGESSPAIEIVMRFSLAAAKVEQRRVYVLGDAASLHGVRRERESLSVKLGFIRIVHETHEWVPATQ